MKPLIDADYVARHRRVDPDYPDPRKIECERYTDFIESCSECPCFSGQHKQCRLIARWTLPPLEDARIKDPDTIHPICPLKLYSDL